MSCTSPPYIEHSKIYLCQRRSGGFCFSSLSYILQNWYLRPLIENINFSLLYQYTLCYFRGLMSVKCSMFTWQTDGAYQVEWLVMVLEPGSVTDVAWNRSFYDLRTTRLLCANGMYDISQAWGLNRTVIFAYVNHEVVERLTVTMCISSSPKSTFKLFLQYTTAVLRKQIEYMWTENQSGTLWPNYIDKHLHWEGLKFDSLHY